MRALAVFVKTAREARRDLLTVALSLVFAPAFVLLYYLAFPSTGAAYQVAVVNLDTGTTWRGHRLASGLEIPAALAASKDGTGRSVLRVSSAPTREEAVRRIGAGEIAAAVVIPRDFSGSVAAVGEDATGSSAVSYTIMGDLTRAAYPVAAVMVDAAVRNYVRETTGRAGPVSAVEQAVGGSGARTDFEIYIPGLIVFSVIMLLFLAAMTVAREIESGAMRRLRLTPMSSADYLVGTSGVIVLIGVAGVVATFGTALLCGFRSEGSLWVGVLVLTITIVSVIGVGMMVAAVSGTVTRAFVIANFPLGLLMFFSGTILPMPRITWLSIAGHSVGPFEALAPTHAVTALGKVLTLGAGVHDVLYELVAMSLLSVAYFAGGVAALRRAQTRLN